jgi:hypothetical protein
MVMVSVVSVGTRRGRSIWLWCLWLLLEQAEADLYGYGVYGFCSNKGRQACMIMESVCGFCWNKWGQVCVIVGNV